VLKVSEWLTFLGSLPKCVPDVFDCIILVQNEFWAHILCKWYHMCVHSKLSQPKPSWTLLQMGAFLLGYNLNTVSFLHSNSSINVMQTESGFVSEPRCSTAAVNKFLKNNLALRCSGLKGITLAGLLALNSRS
jgi:hypothetical protein